jgi:nicotinamidase/pyrazinamidase
MNTLLLVVDMQNDFCEPGGSLFVKGADRDVVRLGRFISGFMDEIDHIILTQDNHNVIDISHPWFWEDKNGNSPPPFTIIRSESVSNGTWKPRFEKEKATEYIMELEKQGEFPHTIWPEHCITGSVGAAIIDRIMEPVKQWARRGFNFDIVRKGTNPLTEHFGVLMANVPIEGSPETQLNNELVGKMRRFENILIAGEAKTHCVANTLKQIMNIEGLAEKIVVLEDCMSDIKGFESFSAPIYDKAKKNGVIFSSTDKWFH